MTQEAFDRRQFLRAAGAAGALAAGAAPSEATGGEPEDAPPARFRLGMVTYNISATWDLPTILRICRATGVAAVELRTTHAHGVEPSLPPGERAEVKKRFADAGLRFWGCGTVCEFHSPDPKVVEQNIETCKQFIGLVADLGGTGVKVRPNGLPKDVPVEKTLAQIGRALVECGRAAADAGLEVWVEVHGGGTAQPANMKAIMEHCGQPNVGVTWNSNGTDVTNGSVASAFEMLRPWVKSCHINELYGSYPYRELFGCLRRAGYDRYTLIEIPQKLDPAAGELLLKYYKALWAELCR